MIVTGDYFDQVIEAAEFLRGRGFGGGEVGMVLGSGLGAFAEQMADRFGSTTARFRTGPRRASSAMPGGWSAGTCTAAASSRLSGRAHFYEGHDLRTVTFAVRVLGRLGVRTLLLTNAAGGINTRFSAGRADGDRRSHQLPWQQSARRAERRPLRAPLSGHDRGLFDAPARIADAVARDIGLPIEHGIYIAVHGPSYETPAEIRAFRALGADAVGMSTVPEAIVARHMGIEVLGHLVHQQHGRGRAAQAAASRRSHGRRRMRVRAEFIALLEGIIGRL